MSAEGRTARQVYDAARTAALIVDRSDLGRLAIRGRDALDLLHRLTTAPVRGLRPWEGVAAVLATPKGRILDLVTLHHVDDGVLAFTGPGRAVAVADWIGRYTFREEVEVVDRSAALGTLGVFGARAGEAIGGAFGGEAAALPLHHARRVAASGGEALITRTYPLAGGGWHVTGARDALAALGDLLRRAAPGAVEAEAGALEVLRIEAGLPAPGLELGEDHNPWEARLHDAIALDKGCYVGQEVIARLNTYKKVARWLVRLDVEGEDAPARGAEVVAAGIAIGAVTSAAAVPGAGRAAALAYVRDEDAQPGRRVVVAGRPATILGMAR